MCYCVNRSTIVSFPKPFRRATARDISSAGDTNNWTDVTFIRSIVALRN
jgi:hypothetical protein